MKNISLPKTYRFKYELDNIHVIIIGSAIEEERNLKYKIMSII